MQLKTLNASSFFSRLSSDAKHLLNEIKEEDDIDPKNLVCRKFDGNIFNFNTFNSLLKFALNI